MHKLYNEKVLKIFMIIQPIIDAITSIMINEFHMSLSIGMVVRFCFMAYAFIYIIMHRNKKIITFIALWAIYIGVSLVGYYFLKENFNIITHGVLLLKMVYFPVVLLFWIVYFKNNKELDRKIFIYIGILVGLSLVVSSLTKTAYCTYSNYNDCYTKGVVAWFNSANEYGLILIALLGLIMTDYISDNDIYNIVALLFTVIFLCILGTKASYIGVVGVIGCYVIYYLVTMFLNYKKSTNLKKIISLILILFVIGLTTSNLPIYTNLVGNYSRAYTAAKNSAGEICEDGYCKDNFLSEEEIANEVANTLMFNGRSTFVEINKSLYKNSNLFNKLFGITTQGNYVKGELYNHISERDFHDLLIYYGIFGFVLLLLLPGYLFVIILKKVIKNIKILKNDEIIIIGIVISFMLLGSFIAGHCLFQPAVSIYLAYLIALFYKKVEGVE